MGCLHTEQFNNIRIFEVAALTVFLPFGLRCLSLLLASFSFSISNRFPPFHLLSASFQTMAEYSSLLSDLSDNITNEDLEQLKSACKEDIPEDQSNNITSSKEWFSYLEKNDKLAQGETSNHRSDHLADIFAYVAVCLGGSLFVSSYFHIQQASTDGRRVFA